MDSGPTDVQFFTAMANQEKDAAKKSALFLLASASEREEERHNKAVSEIHLSYSKLCGK
jgi:hypothetical protein